MVNVSKPVLWWHRQEGTESGVNQTFLAECPDLGASRTYARLVRKVRV